MAWHMFPLYRRSVPDRDHWLPCAMSGIFDAIGIMVKQDGRSIARAGGFDAVAIKVKSQRIMARKYGSLLVPAAQPAPPMHKAGRMNQTRRALGSGPGGE